MYNGISSLSNLALWVAIGAADENAYQLKCFAPLNYVRVRRCAYVCVQVYDLHYLTYMGWWKVIKVTFEVFERN